jgi:hypothetical protein
MATADLLLHPVRFQVAQAFLGDRVLTTAELHAELPDVPTATLYRHVGLLADAGVLAVVRERKVRGAVERSYRLVTEAASVGPDDAREMTPDEHRRAFSVFAAGLLADFERYLERAGDRPDLGADGALYRQLGLWHTDEELTAFLGELRALLQRHAAAGPAEGRRRRVLTSILLPAG